MPENATIKHRQLPEPGKPDAVSPNPDSIIGINGDPDRSAYRRRIIYWSFVAMTVALIITIQPVFAADFWEAFSTIMKDIYGKLLGISTIIAVTAATVALLIRMISRNQRAVDEASSWLKRILVTWVILNTLGFIIAYLQPLIAGGRYTP